MHQCMDLCLCGFHTSVGREKTILIFPSVQLRSWRPREFILICQGSHRGKNQDQNSGLRAPNPGSCCQWIFWNLCVYLCVCERDVCAHVCVGLCAQSEATVSFPIQPLFSLPLVLSPPSPFFLS